MRLKQMKIKELLDTNRTITEKLFEGHKYSWEVLGDINGFAESLDASLPENEYKKIGKNIWIHKTAQVAPTTVMGGPMVIGPKIQIRNGTFLRGGVILGQHVVIGNPCEIKNSVIFDEAQVPHFSYVGDSILGYRAYMGTGAAVSNVKADKGLIEVHVEDDDVETGHRRFGAILSDYAEIDCNNVLNPGAVIGRGSNVYPLSSACGCVPSNSTYRGRDNTIVKEAREVGTEQETPEAPEEGRGGLRVVK